MIKILIIRFSSIGDIIQNMGVIGGLKRKFPNSEIHWVARADMSSFLQMDQRIDQVWAFDKTKGFNGLIKLGKQLQLENFDYIYDGHCNIRSSILNLMLKKDLKDNNHFAQRSKERWKRFLLFKLGINKFPKPFKGEESFQKPLEKWGLTNFEDSYSDWKFPITISEKWQQTINNKTITLVPSANWEMKRWPVSHWKTLIELLPDFNFVILAGPTDSFCREIESISPNRIKNLAGKSSLLESCYLVYKSNIVISADTGFLHAADHFNIPAVALMGPTAFGFPSHPSSKIFEIDLPCRPCTKDGRGKCKQKIYQRCMVEITPSSVAKYINSILK